MRSSDIAKIISRAWKALGESEKVRWYQLAQQDRDRYDREKAAYKGPWKIPNIKDPDTPKKPMSAFLAFGNQRRKAIAEANPSMNGTQISCLLAKLWRESSDEIRQAYRDKEARERAMYKRRRALWERQKKEDTDTVSVTETEAESSQESLSWSDPSQRNVQVEQWGFNSLMRLEQQCLQNFQCDESGDDTGLAVSYPPLDVVPSQSMLPTAVHSLFPASHLVSPSDHSVVSLDPTSIFPPTPSQTFQHVSRNQEEISPLLLSTRFDSYSMDDILQDEELFQDFSPTEAQGVVYYR